jgi:hypothetical protein
MAENCGAEKRVESSLNFNSGGIAAQFVGIRASHGSLPPRFHVFLVHTSIPFHSSLTAIDPPPPL